MAFTVYAVACVPFVLACLAMLWRTSAASRTVESEIAQLRRELDGDRADPHQELEQ
jgi:uncharacterized membrane protein YqjE